MNINDLVFFYENNHDSIGRIKKMNGNDLVLLSLSNGYMKNVSTADVISMTDEDLHVYLGWKK
ncbi:Uncharacterised protein [uncultured archaeon]|nr:Uncharacterised protein [uncultured archaeon]